MSQAQGRMAEEVARDYLLSQGLTWRASNVHTRMGEIDLIMQEGLVVVFVEVRSRRSAVFGGALESITIHKRQKILKTATWYLQRHALDEHYASRFDVLTLQGNPPIIHWIPDAFGSDY